MLKRALLFTLLPLLLGWPSLTAAAQSAPPADSPDITLTGTVRGSQNHSYVEVPFRVPSGLQRVTLTFHYTARDQRTALDLGIEDPDGLRCWSGGNKSTLTIGLSDATPSCLPGPLSAGTWRVLIGVPNIRASVTSQYTAKVYFTRSGLVAAEPAILREPLRSGPAWYRGTCICTPRTAMDIARARPDERSHVGVYRGSRCAPRARLHRHH